MCGDIQITPFSATFLHNISLLRFHNVQNHLRAVEISNTKMAEETNTRIKWCDWETGLYIKIKQLPMCLKRKL